MPEPLYKRGPNPKRGPTPPKTGGHTQNSEPQNPQPQLDGGGTSQPQLDGGGAAKPKTPSPKPTTSTGRGVGTFLHAGERNPCPSDDDEFPLDHCPSEDDEFPLATLASMASMNCTDSAAADGIWVGDP